MKAEFYFDHRRYICSLVQVDFVKELKIKNHQGLVLAVKQGQKVGLIGKTRQDARQVDVSQTYFYNLIKAAMNALDLASKEQVILDKNRAIAAAENIIQQQSREIGILNEQMNMLVAQLELLSAQQQQSPAPLIEDEIIESEIGQEFDRPSSPQVDLPIQEIENEFLESSIGQEFDRPSAPLVDIPIQEIEDRISDSEIDRGIELLTVERHEIALQKIEDRSQLEEIEGEEEINNTSPEETVNSGLVGEAETYRVEEVAVIGDDRDVKRVPRRASNKRMRKKS